MDNSNHIRNHKKIHLIGIGGCSMNGIARILNAKGYYVQGSDANVSPFTKRLEELSIPVTIGHSADNIKDCDMVIYSAAIKEDNVERVEAKRRGIPQIERSVALGQLSEDYKHVVGIAGCHGKTTITSMLSLMAQNGAFDATCHVGGFVEFLNGGVRLGSHDLFVTEACEYVESFLTLRPTVAVINNIDNDHLDYFKTMDNIVNAFRKYIALLPEDGTIIACNDDKYVRELLKEPHKVKNVITYGLNNAQFVPVNVSYDMGNPEFDVAHNGEVIGHIKLCVPGEHNMIDALAATVTALTLNADMDKIESSLFEFRPTRRRFEFYGEKNGVKIYHDYAHHPAEVRATVSAARKVAQKRLICVFQCNSYTRAKTLFTENVNCFDGADLVLVPDIYPGREKDTGIVHAKDMVKAINEGGVEALYIPTFEEIKKYLDENAKEGDLVLTLGSGDVYIKTRLFLED